MNTLLCVSVFLLAAQATPEIKDRERHPLAPSLPLLTKQENEKIDAIIDRFIKYDIGKLQGAAGKKALDEFNTLGPEATFNLIDGLNRTANLESSCPAVLIARKLSKILSQSDDLVLLTYAKENIGAGVVAKRHLNVMKDLQVAIILRKGTLQRRAIAQGGVKGADLEKALNKENGPQLKSLVQRQTGDLLRGLLKHDRKDVRIAAAQTIGAKKLRYGAELIDLLQDSDGEVRQAARRALMQLAGGIDLGPAVDASFDEREAAIVRWRDWWIKQK